MGIGIPHSTNINRLHIEIKFGLPHLEASSPIVTQVGPLLSHLSSPEITA